MQGTARREPRLQMGHLLIWIVGCAVGFAERRSISPTGLPGYREQVIVFSSNVILGMAIGTILTGCGLLAYRRWRGDTSYPSRAGHWLLLRHLAVQAASVAFVHLRLSISVISSSALMIDLAFLWGLHRRLPRHWIVVFLLSSIAAAIQAFGFSAFAPTLRTVAAIRSIGIGSALLDALAILWAIGRDRRSGVPTDGLHRLGIGTSVALDAIRVLFSVVLLAW
jgi:hypothetical protein